jgi:hypothetical protein
MPHAIELCYGSRLHCHWHDEDETETDISRACFECMHVYQTSDELAEVWRKAMGKPWDSQDPIPFCPYCLHDW